MSQNLLLQELVEPSLPASIPFWPQTLGWYLVGAAALLSILVWGARTYIIWRHNRYRREGVRQLCQLKQNINSDNTEATMHSINRCLKHAAASAFGVTEVSSLSGEAWIAFLNKTGEQTIAPELAQRWQGAMFSPPGSLHISQDETLQVLGFALHWLREH